MSNIQKFNPKEIRESVSNQLAQMQEAKYINLPDDYKETVFFALDAMSSLPMIDQADQGSITKAFLSMFKNKLDYTKKHCYFFVQNDGKSKTGKSLRFGWQYQGLISVAKSQCGVVNVRPVLVHKDDIFESHYEYGALIIDKHEPTFEGVIVGGYCVVEYPNKTFLIKYYTREKLDQRRNASKAPNGNFWKWEDEMYEKTLINAVLTRIIETSPDVSSDNLHNDTFAQEQREIINVDVVEQKDVDDTSEENVIKLE